MVFTPQIEELLGGPVPAAALLAPQATKLTPEQRALVFHIEQEEKRQRARVNFKDFIEYMMPDPENYDDRTKTSYISKPIHKLMRQFWTDVECGVQMRSALSIPPQTGKPVADDTLVLMADGSRSLLKEVSVGSAVITKEGRARLVSAVHKQGMLDCVTIKTKTGREVTAALDHPMLTPGGWVDAGGIRPGMSLINVVPSFEHEEPDERGLCAARLAGYFAGDGSCGEYDNGKGVVNTNASITVVDDNELEDIKHCCDVLGFGWTLGSYTKRARTIYLSGGVRPWLRDIGMSGKVSATKRVPTFVFTQHKKVVAHFIGAYFACDGTVSKKGLDRKGIHRADLGVEFYSISRSLLEDVQHLLLRLGVQSSLSKKNSRWKGDPYVSWRLRLQAQDYVSRFIQQVPVFHAKARRFKEREIYRTQPDNIHISDMVVEVITGVGKPCRCLTVEEDMSFLAEDFAVHNTTHITLMGSAWAMGRTPSLKIIVGTYNEFRAKLNGGAIRTLMESDRYKEIFPEVKLAKGGKSKSYLETTHGGYILMAGRGTGVTGNPCDIFVIDDPIKDKAEAVSTAALDESWEWFSTTALQRAHNLTRYVIVHTRWAMNDLIGKICDPEHADYDEERAAPWLYLNVKAFDNEPYIANLLGIKESDVIWPEKFSKELMEGIQKLMGAEDFSALYMGKPVPDEGGFFRREMISTYTPEQLPPLDQLRIYAASDHAVTVKQYSDYTVLLIAGIDKYGQVWLIDMVRRKMKTDQTVEEMLRLMKKYKPLTWWAARDHILQAIGPFLTNRMREEKIYGTYIQESPEIGDKMQKSQSIRGMMALGLVRFPVKAIWYAALVKELLQFRGEGDAYDDQVDTLGHLGRGLDKMLRGRSLAANDTPQAKFGTVGWVRMGEAAERAQSARERATAGW